jgi:hypothetical protein
MAQVKLTGIAQSSDSDPGEGLVILIIEIALFFGLMFIL